MGALFVIKPRKIGERPPRMRIRYGFNAHFQTLEHDGPNLRPCNALSINLKDRDDSVAVDQRVYDCSYRRLMRCDFKLLPSHGNLTPKHVCDRSRMGVKPNCGNCVHSHVFSLVGEILA
ncbi:hypothetical protein BGLT_02196 [Caballeronia glathei]|uniref:Uncharacterized protein n=1 Tax=Caballeronia glathei TaxID=60547 RepID=A0A069PFX2_9BURK|nr:hypothetical protein BG61_31960 [Caballeronia glathei]CDY79415.1 hypothetical protein BGLT_02196 [Caballeronia glathei]